MSRRSDQLDRIEAFLARIEEAVAAHAGHLRSEAAAIRMEVRTTRSSAEAAHAGVQALADMLPAAQADPEPDPEPAPQAIPPAAPQPPSAVPPAADGGTGGEPAAAVRRAPKTLKTKDM